MMNEVKGFVCVFGRVLGTWFDLELIDLVYLLSFLEI